MVSSKALLGKLKKGIVIASLGLEAIIANGCAATLPNMSKAVITAHQSSLVSRIENSRGYLKFLREEEYVIPNKIFDAYAETIDKRPKWFGTPVGGYALKSYLNTQEKREEFQARLKKLKTNDEEIQIYSAIFNRPDVIVFRASLLNDKYFEKALPHERFHKELKRLNSDDYAHLMGVTKKIINVCYPFKEAEEKGISRSEIDFSKEFKFKCINLLEEKYPNGNFYKAAAYMNSEEFYTYMAQGEWADRVEQTLKKEHPKAYKLFDAIREKVRLR